MIRKSVKLIVISIYFLCMNYLQAQNVISLSQDLANGQGSFENVEPGDTVYLESGERGALILENFTGTAENPIIFVPDSLGQLRISGSSSYGISIRNCSYIRLSGYKGSHSIYGIKISDINLANSIGVGMSDKSSDVEIDHIEISSTGFAGILAKTEPVCGDAGTQRGGFIQKNTLVHHCHIYDTGGEGLYIGSTSFKGIETANCGMLYPVVLEGVEVHDNLIERSAWDGIQVSSVVADCHIFNNRLIDCSTAKQANQMSGILIGGGTKADCYNNWIEDCYGTGILVFGFGGTRVFNNVILRPAQRYYPDDPEKRDHGIYLNDKTGVNKTFYGVYSNTIIQPKTDCIRVSGTIDFEVRIYNNIFVDPGAYDVYENDNTDRTGTDAYIFVENENPIVRLAANASVNSTVLPHFTNPDNDDYHLDITSPYIDAGRNLADQGGVNFDFDGKLRPLGSNYDIGAFEYGNTDGLPDELQNTQTVKLTVQNYGEGNVKLILSCESAKQMQISLINSMGQVVRSYQSMKYPPGDYPFHFSHLPDGVYFCIIAGTNWSQSKKLLVY